MRLIDADALFKALERAAWYNNMDRDEIAEEILLQMPTIDALVLPCRVGDTVYVENGDDEAPHFVDAGKVFAIGIDEGGIMWFSVRYESGLKYYHTSNEIGKTLFLTREEAESKLATNLLRRTEGR